MTLLLNSFNSGVNIASNSGASICTGTPTFSISLFSSHDGWPVEMQSTRLLPFPPSWNTAHPPKQKPTAPTRLYCERSAFAHSNTATYQLTLLLQPRKLGISSSFHRDLSSRVLGGRTSPSKLEYLVSLRVLAERDLVVRCLRRCESRRIVMRYSQIWQIDSCISFASVVICQKSQIWKCPAE
jgi:hypothetical protein